jgi:hypothetical protein
MVEVDQGIYLSILNIMKVTIEKVRDRWYCVVETRSLPYRIEFDDEEEAKEKQQMIIDNINDLLDGEE